MSDKPENESPNPNTKYIKAILAAFDTATAKAEYERAVPLTFAKCSKEKVWTLNPKPGVGSSKKGTAAPRKKHLSVKLISR